MKRILGAASLAALVVGCGAHEPPPNAPSPTPFSAPRVTPGALPTTPILGDLPQKAEQAGASPVAVVASGPMVEGERMGAFVDIPKDACLLTYARASSSLEDIDLAAFADEGNPVGVDEGPDPKPTVLVCPPHPQRVYVAAHAASGEGMCVIAAQLVPPVRAAEVGKLAGARGVAGGAPRSPEAWPGLDDKVRAHRASLGGTWEELRRVAISVDARAVASVAFAVEEGGCTDALLVPDEDVAMVEGDVLDGEGRIVGRAKEGADGRTVTVCSPIAMTGSIQIRPHVGRGLVAVVLSRAKGEATRSAQAKAEVAWVAPQQSLDVTRAARNALLQRAGYAAPSSTLSGQLALGRRVTLPIDLRGGACSRLDVVAGAPLALLEASVWTDGGALLASGDGTDGATLFACGGGKARLDLGTRGRPGPYSVLVRAEPWKDPALTAHPLAGGRMLAHAASGPNALLEGTASSIRHVLLDAAHQHVQNAAVPPGQCLRVAVGAEGAGTGLEARLVDAVDGDELDRSAGQHGVAVRACAGGETRSVRFELRASAGKLETVIGERLAPAR